MKLKIKIFTIVLIFFCVINLRAQDTLRYEKVLDEALEKNLFIKNEQLNIELAKENYYRSNNFFPKFPELDMEYETDKFYEDNGNKLFSLTLSQEIEIGGQFSARNDISNYRVRQSEMEYKVRNYEIEFEIKSLLNNVITLQLKHQITNEIHKINEELLVSSERRLRAGDISELDYNLVLIETNNSTVNLRVTETEFKTEVRKLNVYLGYDKEKIFYVNPVIPIRQNILSLEQLQRNAVENRYDIKALQFEKLAAGSEVSLYKSENIPNLKLSVGYSNVTAIIPGDDIIGEHNILRIKDDEKNLKFGIGFSVPLPFNGLFNYNQGNIRAAEVRTKIINNKIGLIRKVIIADVENAFNKWESSKKNIELLQINEQVIERTLELLIRGYERGEISLITYLTEKQKLYEMKLNFIDISRDLNQSILELEKVTQTKIQ
ncbi:MAG: TolC family protein [Ignavibacteria bacterium]